MFKFEKIVWIKDAHTPVSYGVCGRTGRIARITHFYDVRNPPLVIPIDRTPMKIENEECSCACTCLDVDCDLNCFDKEEFFKHYNIDPIQSDIDHNFGCRTFYFNIRKVELIDLKDFFMFPEIPHVFQDTICEIVKE